MNQVSPYQATINYLYEKLPMFQRQGATAIKKDLGNIRKFCMQLQNPQAKFPSIHIAGTNGKGSTAHILAALLQVKGKKVGLYTSPHYKDFRERIKINGTYISEEEVVDFVEKHKLFIEKVKPSFFEITVAMAFDYFAKQQVDIAIIETGLGGRLDSTNVITPILSVITNISYDHQSILGDTLPKIATEKAGIIKDSIPVVVGEKNEETRPVFEQKAAEANAKIYFARDTYNVLHTVNAFTHSIFNIYKNGRLHHKDVEADIAGHFQEQNLTTAIQVVDVLNQKGFQIEEEDLRKALLQVKKLTGFIGRCYIIGERPLILCDSGHNVAGIHYMMQQMKDDRFRDKHFVIGAVKDKDLDEIMRLYPKDATYYFTKPNIPRGLDANELKAKAEKLNLNGEVYDSVKLALDTARSKAKSRDLIFVGGSTFVVAEVI